MSQLSKYALLNKVLLANIKYWLEEEEKNNTTLPEIAIKLKSFAKRYLLIHHGFTQDEIDFMKTIETDHFKKMLEPEISYLVFCLELARLWYQDIPKEGRPVINIGRKHMLRGSRLYVVDMLKLKKEDEEKYKELRSILDDTRLVSRKFYEYIKMNCVKE